MVGPPTAAASRGKEGGRGADEPIKKWYLAGGWGEARVGKERRAPARGAKEEGWVRDVYEEVSSTRATTENRMFKREGHVL